jgi:hypothetical protein
LLLLRSEFDHRQLPFRIGPPPPFKSTGVKEWRQN